MKTSTLTIVAITGFAVGIGFTRLVGSSQLQKHERNPQLIGQTVPLKESQPLDAESFSGKGVKVASNTVLHMLSSNADPLDLRIAVTEWAERDPHEVLSFIDSSDIEETQRSQLLKYLFHSWALSNPVEAIEATKILEKDQDLAMSWISATLRKSDPLMAILIDFRDHASDEQLTELWDLASAGDADSVANYLLSAKTAKLTVSARTELLTRIAEAKYHEDPEAAFRWAVGLKLPDARWSGIEMIVAKMAKSDPALAVRHLESLPNWRNQVDAVEGLARSWHEQDASAAIRWAGQSLTGDDRSGVLQEMLNDTLASDPAAAAKLAVDLTSESKTNFANFTRIAGRYADHNPEEALAWLRELPASIRVNRSSVAAEIASSWSFRDPDAARVALSKISDPVMAAGFAEGIGLALGETSPTEALEWVSTVPESLSEPSMGSVLSGYAKSDPVAASSRVSDLEDDRVRLQTASSVAREWANSDPIAAANWAVAIEEAPVQAAAIGQVVRAWARSDPNAAAQWVNEFPEGAAKDESAAEIANAVVITDPEAAFQWAVSIEGNGTQWRTLPSIVASWAVRDANAALAAIEEADLRPQQIDTLHILIENIAP